MKREEIIENIGSGIVTPIKYVLFIFILGLVSSPFIWMWHSWSLAWRVFLTSLFLLIIGNFVLKIVNKVVAEAADEYIKESSMPRTGKSVFMQKIEERLNQNKN